MSDRFFGLLQQAETAFADGQAQSSIELFTEAENLAAEHGWDDLADRAFCNRCAVLIELDQGAEQIPRLKHILLCSRNARNRWLAAYYSAVAYDVEGEAEKAASYARRAMELAGELDEPVIRSRCANLLGTLAVRASRFDEAEQAYGEALQAHRGLDGYHRITQAQVKDNLGYVMLCTDRLHEGLKWCEEARCEFETLEVDYGLHEVLQDLCYGYILDDDLSRRRGDDTEIGNRHIQRHRCRMRDPIICTGDDHRVAS